MYSGTQVLALTLSLCLMTACKEKNQNNQSQLVNVVEVTPSAGTTSASYPAETEAMNKTDLSFKVAGTIAQVLVKEGDHVQAGQAVARLDDRDYRTQLRATEAEYNQVKAECERIMAMHKERAVSDNNYDKARYGLQQMTEKLAHHRNQLSDSADMLTRFTGSRRRRQVRDCPCCRFIPPRVSMWSSTFLSAPMHSANRLSPIRQHSIPYQARFSRLP